MHNVGADPGYVYAPYQLLTQPDELSGAEFVYDSHLARAEDIWTHTLYVQPDATRPGIWPPSPATPPWRRRLPGVCPYLLQDAAE